MFLGGAEYLSIFMANKIKFHNGWDETVISFLLFLMVGIYACLKICVSILPWQF